MGALSFLGTWLYRNAQNSLEILYQKPCSRISKPTFHTQNCAFQQYQLHKNELASGLELLCLTKIGNYLLAQPILGILLIKEFV